MKNYLIETTANGYFVHVGDEPFGGPYKNEESAKRRIRDLKRKENEQREIVADMQATGMMPIAEKIAASSAYGKFKLDPVAFAKAVNTDHPQPSITASHLGYNPRLASSDGVERRRGVYPAISKHAYQR